MIPFPVPGVSDVRVEEISLGMAFELAAARFARDPGTVLLLSGSDLDCARFNLVGIRPWLTFRGWQERQKITVRRTWGAKEFQEQTFEQVQDPFDTLQALMDRCSAPAPEPDLPVSAGLFGYLAYDLKDRIENLPRTCAETGLPDICLYAPSVLLVQDRKKEKTYLCITVPQGVDARDHIVAEKAAFFAGLDRPWHPREFSIASQGFTSSFTRPDYIQAVSKIIRHLKAGDIYQANLSQRFETGFTGDAYALFLKLFQRNPASFFSFIQAKDHEIVSTSPERFIRLQGQDVETRPIKGTIARGRTQKADEENRRALAKSAKDDAELTMIVDLMRNDLSRVTEHDSVVVSEHKRLEPYENVFHLVSVVQGKMRPGKTAVDLVRATFPGGSITGCPKIRSMEIIDELEPVKRHVYTGSIGYLSFHGTMDLSIAIRTATIAQNRLYFSVGGGIVFDSDPQKEFQETLDKGKTLMDTLVAESTALDNEPDLAWVNGKLVDRDQARVPADSFGFQYGAGLFETLRVEKGRVLNLAAHVNRMNRSWQQVFNRPAPDITWDAVITRLIRENRLEQKICAVKLMAALGKGGDGTWVAAFIRPYVHRLSALGKTGLDLVTFPEPRFSWLAGHKTLNYLFYDRAGQYAREQGGDEALILNPDLTVSETHTCNIMALGEREVILPQSDHALPGITLAAVLDRLMKEGYQVRKMALSAGELAGYTNLLVTNSLMGAVKVLSLDKIPISHTPGLCDRVNQILELNSDKAVIQA